MTPADLAKFNLGDKAIVSFEAEFPEDPRRTDMPDWIWVRAVTGKDEDGHDIACIKPISIERVRPALPTPWFWHEDGRGAGAKMSKGRMTPAAFVWRGDGEDIKVDIEDGGTRDIPFAVIEAVRNA